MNSTEPVVLRNRCLTARFCRLTGRLVYLAAPRGKNLVESTQLVYHDRDGKRLVNSDAGGPQATPSGVRIELAAWTMTDFQADKSMVVTNHKSDHIETQITWRLDAKSPLLHVTARSKGTGRPGTVVLPSLPRFHFTEGFVNGYEDDKDLFFDGAELGGGRELPPWRVFLRKGYRKGLILAARSKDAMSRFNLQERGFELWPHTKYNYSTSGILNPTPFDTVSGKAVEVQFEIGPWTKASHAKLLREAKLEKAVKVNSPPPSGKPPRKLKGVVLHAAKLAKASQTSMQYRRDRWMKVAMPWSASGTALFANTGVKPPAIVVDPKLAGPHRVFLGIGQGCGATMEVTGDPEKRYRMGPTISDTTTTGFDTALSGPHKATELNFGVIDLTGRKLRIGRLPSQELPATIDYVRFEALSKAALKQWNRQATAEPVLPLSGLNDIPDIAAILDANDPDPRAYTANIWEHANSKVNKIYWRVDGQCSDFPSKLNTMRYISGKTHGVFNPQSKAYGRVLKKTNILRLAVDAAKRYGVSLYGWMRFNSYMGNVQSDFYKNHPEYWEEWDNGRKGGKLCLAHKAVREHKINILVEAAKYGLDGVCLGFLRHPPVLQYAPILVEGYLRKYGKLPPRDAKHPDAHHRTTLPKRDDPEYERYWRYRAEFMTQFGRELKRALKREKLGHVKVAIWVRPNHCLFDGIDMDTWLAEGLCDEVVSQAYASGADADPAVYWETPEWKQKVQAKVPLIRTVTGFSLDKENRADLDRILAGGYDGLCTYESDYSVLDSDFIDFYRSLRK